MAKLKTIVASASVAALLALPTVGALAWGADAGGIDDLRNAGATPGYGQIWVGLWTKNDPYGWSSYEDALRDVKAKGVTPVIMWYYWGDSISTSCVQYGCDGRSKSSWDSMANELARRANAVMGSSRFYVVLEPEFNKGGISDWETFDGYLAAQAGAIRYHAPNAKIVVGFGHWGGWSIFDRAAGASDMVGFQELRASTRDSAYEAEHVADNILRVAQELRAQFRKDILVFDLGIATYGGWEGVQERALQNLKAKQSELEAAGVKGIVWRYMRDNDNSSGYFGAAESSWGVITKWGSKKRAFDDLVALVKGGSTSTPTTTSASAISSPFTSVKGNEWWIEAKTVRTATAVHARVNGGSWVALPKTTWGAWAKSVHAPSGSTVDLRATYADGTTATASYAWPTATLVAGASGSTSAFTATFKNVGGNEWWIQTDVSASGTVTAVYAQVDGGSWTALSKQSWGAWAKSIHAPAGSRVQLKAVASDGAASYSATYTW